MVLVRLGEAYRASDMNGTVRTHERTAPGADAVDGYSAASELSPNATRHPPSSADWLMNTGAKRGQAT